jgi:hypothetical protein
MRQVLFGLTIPFFTFVSGCDKGPDGRSQIAAGATPAAGHAAPASAAEEITVRRGLSLAGGTAGKADVTLGAIPTRPLSSQTWVNPVTNAVEQRITPAILHPIPVLRAGHVMVFGERPDLAKVGLDQLMAAAGEAEVTAASRYALVASGGGEAFLLALSDAAFPEDREGEWRIRVAAERAALAGHVRDAVADRGRAVAAREALPLSGQLIYARKNEDHETFTLVRRDAAAHGDANPAVVGKGRDLRVADNGAFADRVDENTIEVTDAAGRRAGTVKVDMPIEDFNISPDGKRIVLATERRPLDKEGNVDVWGKNRQVSAVYEASGKLVGEVEGCDDAAFLPDGRLVVTGRGFGPGLFVADVATGKRTEIQFEGGKEGAEPPVTAESPRTPAVSADGKRVAYCDGRDVYVVGIDGRGWTPVWKNEKHEPQHRPVFSPDGRYLAIINVPLNVMNGPGQVIVFDLERQVMQAVGGPADADSDGPLAWLQ